MKVWNYVFISLGLILLLHFAGQPTGADPIFDLVGLDLTTEGEIENVSISATGVFETLFSSSDDGNNLTGILFLIGAVVASIAVGLFTRARPENLILLPLITGTLTLFIMTFVTIMQTAIATGQTWFATIVVLLFLPFALGFIIALAEFFRGTD